MRRLALALLLTAACSERIKKIDPPPPDAGCGDGLINALLGEECEGSDLNGATCQSLGFDEGQLSCSDCKLVKTLCVKKCGNGMLDPGEGCDGDAGISGCTDFGFVSCTEQCQVNRAHCVTSPFQAANGALMLVNGGPAVVADTPPHGLGDLVMTVQSRSRVEVLPYTVQQGFLANGLKLSFGNEPVQAIAVGDDVIALNRDGTLDRYRYNGTGYALASFPDAGCSASIVGEVSAGAVATSSCDGGEVLVWSAASVTRAAASGGTCSIADFDRDGARDVLVLNGTQLEVHAAPSFAGADAGQLPLAVTSLVAADFDDDGDTDLAGLAGGNVKLIENLGNAFADRLTVPAAGAHDLRAADLDLDGHVDLVWEAADKALVRRNQGAWVFAPFEATFGGNGPPLSFAVGDVDGDGDLDLVSTRAGTSDSSVSYVQLNRVR